MVIGLENRLILTQIERANGTFAGVFLVTMKVKVQNIQMGHVPSYIIMRLCRYIEFCANTLRKKSTAIRGQETAATYWTSPLLSFIDSFILSSVLKGVQTGEGRL